MRNNASEQTMLKVPPYGKFEAQTEFVDKLKKSFEKKEDIILDFHGILSASSMVIGSIIFMGRRSEAKVKFMNLCSFLYEELRTLMGPHLDKFCDRPIDNNEVTFVRMQGKR